MRANRDVIGLQMRAGPNRSGAFLMRWKVSLMSGFNSLLGPNYFPVPLRREIRR